MLDSTIDSLPTDSPLADLGPLAWVFDELRKSLDGANKAAKRFVREAAQLEPGGLDAPDPSPLRLARQQLHQAVGALEMVGLEQPAQVLRGMEAAVHRFVQRPQSCDEAAVQRVEHAGFALLEYLQAVLNNKPLQPLALFPQYHSVQKLAGVERIHPADLWSFDRLTVNMDAPPGVSPKEYSESLRSLFERTILLLVKEQSSAASQSLMRLCASLSVGSSDERARTLWHVAAAFFEGTSQRLIPTDIFAKRAISRLLLQFNALMGKGPQADVDQPGQVSETLLRDLLFFCAHVKAVPDGLATPYLTRVRDAYGFNGMQWVDYTQASLGRFDPALLAQARKRVQTAKESWGLFTSGDVNRVRQVVDQYGLVGDSLSKLHAPSAGLGAALNKAVDQAVREAKTSIRPELSMEVATTTLYLEAALDDFDPGDATFTQRSNELVERLERVLSGEPGRPLDAWMEQLYRRVSDRQTMGSVVSELKVSLAETEKTLDQFFRTPNETAGLLLATSQLAQMRGVLSVLGLEQAVQTVNRMRTTVEQILDAGGEVDHESDPERFQRLGNNLSALSFLVDMLNYQPSLAKKLFVFDEASGELRPLMGRASPSLPAPGASTDEVQEPEVAVVAPAAAERPTVNEPAPAAVEPAGQGATQGDDGGDDDEDEDLRAIFLEEAREVVVNGNEAVRQLRANPEDMAQLTTLRRAFHTLKGSSRMVGLSTFGEAAWAMEQLFNAVLAEQRPAKDDLLDLAHQSLAAFARWADSIESKTDQAWQAQPFIESAQALREQTGVVPLAVPGAEEVQPLPEWEATAEPEPESTVYVAPDPTIEAEELDRDGQNKGDAWGTGDFAATSPAALNAALADPAEESTDANEVSSDPSGLMSDIDFNLVRAPESRESTEDASSPADAPALTDVPDVPVEVTAEDAPPPSPDLPSMFDGLTLDFDDIPSVEQAQDSAEADAGSLPELDAFPVVEDVQTPDEVPQPVEVDLGAELPVGTPDDTSETEMEVSEPAQSDADASASKLSAEDVPTAQDPASGEAANRTQAKDELPDEQTRVIGPLRIDLKLYNVYLNEADVWSRRLCTALSEWLLECHEPVPAQAESLAHSLAGSSATVGFQPLSDIARALEHALGAVALHQREGCPASKEQAQLFVDASEDIRRLLHQFAAGFFKEPSAELLDGLYRLLHELPSPVVGSANEAEADPVEDVEQELAGDAESETQEDSIEETLVAPESIEAIEVVEVVEVNQVGEDEIPTLMAPLPAISEHSGFVQDIDDDIDVLDSIDVDLFPIFEEEASELLPALGSALRQWAARPENSGARNEVLRNLHTLKGSARLAGALRLGEMAHRLETDVERLDLQDAASDSVQPLLGSYDAIVARFEMLKGMDPDSQGVVQVAPEQDLQSEPPVQVDLGDEAVVDEESVDVAQVDPGDEAVASAPVAVSETGVDGLTLPAAPKLAAARAGAAIRVRPELLDRLVSQTGEVITTRSRMDSEAATLRNSLKELTGNLERLRQQLHDMEIQAETQMQARLAQAREADQVFDPLELDRFTRVQEITRMMAESVNDVATVQRNLQRAVEVTEDGLAAMGRQTRELQRDLLRTRMVEFEGISERLYRVVRQASKETGKQVRLDITGGHIEMDRGVLDRMTAAFEHVLRNCVVHGIEAPEVRLAAGKSAEGRIHIQLAQELNDVSVVFQDDGAGLNLGRLRDKGEAMGLVSDGRTLSDAEAIELVFTPGLSTASEVSSLAGRGVGMDVVRNDVLALGGRVETSTREGQGTAFKLVLPLTTAVTQVVMLRAGSFTVGVPSTVVERVRRMPAQELNEAYAKGTLTVGDEEVPFYWAGALMQTSVKSDQMQERTQPVVVFRSAAQRVAMHVDEVLGNQEVVVKNLGSQLSRLPGLAGMSVLASGAVALIYNPVALAKVYGNEVREWLTQQMEQQSAAPQGLQPEVASAPVNAVPLVLVVDDSITVRRVTQRLLQREGYRVSLAADGLQALERLQQERPSVVLSDIEMPRMDGFDLVRNMRNDPQLSDLPVIMITSRIAEKHREHARELGVDHYLGKPYSEEELLGLIAHYTRVPASA
jgi:chemosensory pili system protein ChpA (sensor histidine kinase/response regulator)